MSESLKCNTSHNLEKGQKYIDNAIEAANKLGDRLW
jgi:hypothetical protein